MDLFFRFLHIAVAAAWFGHKLLIPRDMSSAVAAGLEQARDLIPRLDRAERLGQITGVGTLLTGLALASWLGFDTIASQVFVGLGLVVLAIAIGAVFARPASNHLLTTVTEGDMAGAAESTRVLSRVLAVESLLWTATLVLMLV